MIDRILIVDDEFLVREFLEETISRHDIDYKCAASGEEAMELIRDEDFQLAFVDYKMKKANGVDVLKFAMRQKPGMLFVIMTAYGTIETAVEAMKIGAFDFVPKPLSPDQIDIIIEKAGRWLGMDARQRYFQANATGSGAAADTAAAKTVGESPQILEVNRLVQRVAPTGATVLVTGESGTGKELVASEIHRLSDPRGEKPYIRMNCAAVPETLLESELFGHEKGAFTGASERRVGRFELANGGTLLLDEIGEINVGMQAKLLRVLQESEFERVGGGKTIKVNTRVVATTNRDLKAEVAAGNFREDLYYRLNVFPIHLPPLRQRQGDANRLAQHFLAAQSRKLGRPLEFDAAALAALAAYRWPGNIREMENVIERVAILEDGPVVGLAGLPPDIANPDGGAAAVSAAPSAVPAAPMHPATPASPPVPGQADAAPPADAAFNLANIERYTIGRALKASGGNRTKAAEMLGFSVRTLRNKINEYVGDNSLDTETLALIDKNQ